MRGGSGPDRMGAAARFFFSTMEECIGGSSTRYRDAIAGLASAPGSEIAELWSVSVCRSSRRAVPWDRWGGTTVHRRGRGSNLSSQHDVSLKPEDLEACSGPVTGRAREPRDRLRSKIFSDVRWTIDGTKMKMIAIIICPTAMRFIDMHAKQT